MIVNGMDAIMPKYIVFLFLEKKKLDIHIQYMKIEVKDGPNE